MNSGTLPNWLNSFPTPGEPWSGTDPGMMLPSDVRELEMLLESVMKTTDRLTGAIREFQERYGS